MDLITLLRNLIISLAEWFATVHTWYLPVTILGSLCLDAPGGRIIV